MLEGIIFHYFFTVCEAANVFFQDCRSQDCIKASVWKNKRNSKITACPTETKASQSADSTKALFTSFCCQKLTKNQKSFKDVFVVAAVSHDCFLESCSEWVVFVVTAGACTESLLMQIWDLLPSVCDLLCVGGQRAINREVKKMRGLYSSLNNGGLVIASIKVLLTSRLCSCVLVLLLQKAS